MKNIFDKTQLKTLLLLLAVFFYPYSPLFAQSPNFVQNPGFENANNTINYVPPGASPLSDFIVLNGSNTLTNWGVGGVVDLHAFGHRTMGASGNHIDLNTTGSVTQTITGLTIGGKYRINFITRLHVIVNCFPPGNLATTVTVQFGTMLVGNPNNTVITLTSVDQSFWTQHTYDFTATTTSEILSFTGAGCHASGGGLVDQVSLTQIFDIPVEGNCDSLCEDDDWYALGTQRAPQTIYTHAFRIGNTGIGTRTPDWNFKLTVDNRDNLSEPNNNRNAIHAISMHENCSHGYGIISSVNVLGGTKAIAVQGDGADNAFIFGNGMSWFKSRMVIGGVLGSEGRCDLNGPAGPKLIINGSGLVNGTVEIASDARFKEKIKTIENTSEVIKRLNPVSYQYKTEAFKDRNFHVGMTYGFIAQELKEVLPNSVTLQSDGYYSVNYISLIPVLTQAIKEQQKQIEELKAKLDATSPAINKTSGTLGGSDPKVEAEISKTAELFQNVPNPLNDVTFIDYYLPETVKSAFIKVIDNNGKLVQAFPLSKTGYGQLELDCKNLVSGTYHYSLLADDQLVETKTMIIVKD